MQSVEPDANLAKIAAQLTNPDPAKSSVDQLDIEKLSLSGKNYFSQMQGLRFTSSAITDHC